MSKRRMINLTGINSGEIYSFSYPQSILKFASYDFSGFIKRSTDYCNRCRETGEYRLEDIVALRNSVSACHKYVEANIHGSYEKVVQDLFIEYICREKGVGISTLWNELISAKTPFDKLLFSRLTEYRHNKAVNQWVSLLRLQEYAKRKLDFIFSEKTTLEKAYGRRDYFDLIFSIAANEMGYPTECFASAKVYAVGRLPAAPFITGNTAKAVASSLTDIEYSDTVKKPFSHIHSDNEAMDVFAAVKGSIPEKPDSVLSTIISTMRSLPKKVYVSDSLKAVIDLEIDLLLESGAVLQRCARCGEYFVRDSEYDHDYCSKVQQGGRTCLELSITVPPRTPDEIKQLDDMTGELYTYMSKRINVDLTQRDFAEWYQSFMAIKESILHNTLSIAEFREFEKYSHELHFTPSAPEPPKQPEQPSQSEKQPEVKPFVFERVDRSVLYEQEYRRRKQEREQEEQEEQEEAESLARQTASAVFAEAKPPVHVMKAEDTENISVTVFENPFDGAFDDSLTGLQKISDRTFKPLDTIFSFDETDDDMSAKGGADIDSGKVEKEDTAAFAADNAPIADSGFAGEFAKADYNRRSPSKSSYAAGMYKRTAETTGAEEYPEIQQGGERITQDDFDILPSSATPAVSASAQSENTASVDSHPVPVIKLDAPLADDIEEYDEDDKPGRTDNSAIGKNTAKRLLDGLKKPSKIRNPFLDDIHDD